MTVESSLTYQQAFFKQFGRAWQERASYALYVGIDQTATTLRLEVEETPGYILAYDKAAQDELAAFLQKDFVAFLRQHIPFFETGTDGLLYFGDWYHRREFGRLNVFKRTIDQYTEEQRAIMPQLKAFEQDPDHYLDLQIEAMRKQVYADVNTLHNQLEAASAEDVVGPTRQSGGAGASFRGLLKNFIEPAEEEAQPAAQPTRARRRGNPSQLRTQFDQAKAQADTEFDAKKRALQVSAAITRYEYQAITETFSSVTQFETVLTNLKRDFMQALNTKGGQPNA